MADPAGTKIVEEPKKRTNRPPRSPRHPKAPEEAEKRAKPSRVPYHPGKCRKRPSRIKVEPVSGSFLLNSCFGPRKYVGSRSSTLGT